MSEVLQDRVLASLDRSELAFNEGRSEFFDEFSTDAVIFTADRQEPIKGREAYRRSYEGILAGQQRQKTILERNLQLVGQKAVVTQKAQITQAGATANVLQTLVYGETGEGLKVLHSQTSLLNAGTNDSWTLPSNAVRVVNEKIATAADVVGVAQ